MRKANAVISMAVVVLLLIHAVVGGFQLMGVLHGGNRILTVLAWVMTGLIVLHIVIGIKLTVDTLYAIRKAGISYGRENRIFWARRISGFAIMLFAFCHVSIFLGISGDVFRLTVFEGVQLATQILLVASIAVHVLTNIKPLLISFGIKGFRIYVKDVLFVLAIVMLFCGTAMVIYYLRWNVLWR
ncbi:MAG: pilus assembly protein PilX [Lachnospiraceae bacterium]|nr:pilus assembly protein PilX [Lachnospiraceae bacterium]